MSTKFAEDVYVTCPMYCKEASCEIRCLPLTDDATHTTINFKNAEVKRVYKKDFCKGCFWNCSVYRAIAESEDGIDRDRKGMEERAQAKYRKKMRM